MDRNSAQRLSISRTAVVDKSGLLPAVSSDQVSFLVFGTPAPQGSKKALPIYSGPRKGLTKAERKRLRVFTGKVNMVEQNKKNIDPWRDAVQQEARMVFLRRKRKAFTGPVTVGMGFTLERGKSVTRELPCNRPDISKLVRSTEDAITDAKLWRDDGLVTSYIWLEMVYAGDLFRTGPMAGHRAPARPGVVILIAAVDVLEGPADPGAGSAGHPVKPQRASNGSRSAQEPRARSLGPATPVKPSAALLEALRASDS
jgi:Holliday junction resolvase RusA-like endonuclease